MAKTDKKSKYATQWNKDNPERRKEIQARYRAKHAEKIREARLSKKDEAAAYHREWRKLNPEKVTKYRKSWRERHPDELQLLGSIRRAKMRGIKIVKEDIHNWYSKECGVCDNLIEGKFHIDHIVPLSRGGLHVVTNLQLAHPSCNTRKHNKLPSEMLERVTV